MVMGDNSVMDVTTTFPTQDLCAADQMLNQLSYKNSMSKFQDICFDISRQNCSNCINMPGKQSKHHILKMYSQAQILFLCRST